MRLRFGGASGMSASVKLKMYMETIGIIVVYREAVTSAGGALSGCRMPTGVILLAVRTCLVGAPIVPGGPGRDLRVGFAV